MPHPPLKPLPGAGRIGARAKEIPHRNLRIAERITELRVTRESVGNRAGYDRKQIDAILSGRVVSDFCFRCIEEALDLEPWRKTA